MLKTASWVLLTVVGGVTLLASLVSANLAYRGGYPIGGIAVAEVAAGRPEVLTALRGIRGTSAAYAGGYALLFLATVLGPYRRREKGAWWAILAATTFVVLVSAARIPLLGLSFGSGGTGPALLMGALVVLALLLDVGRLRAR
jgi:hypothetical protein